MPIFRKTIPGKTEKLDAALDSIRKNMEKSGDTSK